MTTQDHQAHESDIERPGCSCGHDAEPAGVGRRKFLTGAAAVGAGAIAGGGLASRLSFAATPAAGDVLVVLSLRGGFDGLNAIVPRHEPRYHQLRPNIGIPQRALLDLDNRFGLHPALAPLKPLWKTGTFGVVHSVGMKDPTRSHFAAMAEMERAAPGSSLRTGWIDRLVGVRAPGTSYEAMQIGDHMAAASFTGPRPELTMYTVDDFRLSGIYGQDSYRGWKRALRRMNANAPKSLASPAEIALSALDDAKQMQRAGYRPRSAAHYPATSLGHAMKDLARLIKAGVGLRVASIDYGEWDMHAGMGRVGSGWLHAHLTELGRSLAAFAKDLGPALNRVTLVTLSEFGRRLQENGSGGTDHGHGQAVLLLGGGVRGGRVHGTWPGLADGDLVQGDLAGTTDYRVLLAEALQKRCGVSGVNQVFPGIPPGQLNVFRPRY